MPVMRFRVVCGLSATMEILSPIIALKKVDLPTFGRPSMAMKPDLNTTVLQSMIYEIPGILKEKDSPAPVFSDKCPGSCSRTESITIWASG